MHIISFCMLQNYFLNFLRHSIVSSPEQEDKLEDSARHFLSPLKPRQDYSKEELRNLSLSVHKYSIEMGFVLIFQRMTLKHFMEIKKFYGPEGSKVTSSFDFVSNIVGFYRFIIMLIMSSYFSRSNCLKIVHQKCWCVLGGMDVTR